MFVKSDMLFVFFFFVICNKFELLTFSRCCKNTLKMWWKILCSFVRNVHPLFSDERNL